MFAQIVNPTPIVLDIAKGIRREPVRPEHARVGNFIQEFDDSTLFFDVFFDAQGTRIIFNAPSFFNLLPHVSNMTVTALPSGQKCPFDIVNMNRHAQIRVPIPVGTNRVTIDSALGRFEISPNRNISEWFKDKRVLLTLSKNNRVEWIADWIKYNRDIHGANAVLLYDNASSTYSPQELLDSLSLISGIDCACVVVWPFKYGPQGLDANQFWDSDFCQAGALEHARWIGLARASSVLNSDIDELVVSPNGSSIFEATEQSWTGTVRFQGVWVYGIDGKTRQPSEQAPFRFTDFDHYLRPRIRKKFGVLSVLDDGCPTKWTVVPSRCPESAQWTVHRIKNWINAFPKSSHFCYRHFREITNHWKYNRSIGNAFASDRFEYDKLAVSAYTRVAWAS